MGLYSRQALASYGCYKVRRVLSRRLRLKP